MTAEDRAPSESMVSPEAFAAGALRRTGIVIICLGVLSLIAPVLTGIAVSILVGIALLAAGVLKIIPVARSGSWSDRWEDLLLGGLAGLVGLVLMIRPLVGLAAITVVLAVYLAASGLLQIALWWRFRRLSGSVMTLLAGAVTLLLALLIAIEWPWSGGWAVGTLVGIHLVMSGLSLVSLASAASGLDSSGEAAGCAKSAAAAD